MALRYPDGDVIIELGEGPNDDFVLYSSVLKISSEFFRASLSPEWIGNKLGQTKRVDGVDIQVKRFRLEYDQSLEDWFLVGAGSSTHTEHQETARPSKKRSYRARVDDDIRASTTPPDSTDGRLQSDKTLTIEAFKLVFAWMHHQLTDVPGDRKAAQAVAELALRISQIQDYLQVDKFITFDLESFVLNHCKISNSPCLFLRIGNTIKSEAVFNNAFKHAVGKYTNLTDEDYAHIKDNHEIVELLKGGLAQLKSLVATTNRGLAALRQDDEPQQGSSAAYLAHVQEILRRWILEYLFQVVDYTCIGAAYWHADFKIINRVAQEYINSPAANLPQRGYSASGKEPHILSWALTKLILDIRDIVSPLFVGRTDILDNGIKRFFEPGTALLNQKQAYFLCATPSRLPWKPQSTSS